MKNLVYLDNAATTKNKPESVKKAIIENLNMTNSGRGGASLTADKKIFLARENIANFFGIKDSSNFAFTSNSTESLNIAIKGLFNEGDHIITTVMEHNSVLRPLYEIECQGVALSFIETDKNGVLKYDDIEKNINKNTKAIICTHISNLTGNIVDIKKVVEICKKNNLIFILDASQSAGFLDIDVERDNIDILCITGHKSLYGVQGIGGIYVKKEIDIRSLKTGGTGIDTYSKIQPQVMPTHLEAGTLNGLGVIGLSAGIDFIRKTNLENIRNHDIELTKRLYDGIKDIKNIKIYGDFENLHAPIVSFNIGEYSSDDIAQELLDNYGIASRSGGHCAPLMHVALGTKKQGMVRLSIGYFNTDKDIDITINAIKEIANSVK